MWKLFQLDSTWMAKSAERPLETVCATPMDPNGLLIVEIKVQR